MASETQVAEVEVQVTALALSKRVLDLEGKIKLFAAIATPEEYEIVANYGRDAATIVREAESFYAEEIAVLYGAWKAKTTERASITGPAEAVKVVAARLCGSWQTEQERLRREKERALEEEQLRLAETALVDEAAALERQGRTDEAEAMMQSEVAVAPVAVASNVPKVSGVSAPRKTYSTEITSIMLLAKGVVEGKVPVQAIMGNQKFLDNQARAMKGLLNYPGVKVKDTSKVAFRS